MEGAIVEQKELAMGVSFIGLIVVGFVIIAVVVGVVLIVLASGRSDRERE